MKVLSQQIFQNGLIIGGVPLTDANTIASDASNGSLFTVTLGGNRILANPTNATDGQIIRYRIKQDSVGSHTLSLDTKFRFGAMPNSINLSITPNAVDYLEVAYVAVDDKFDVLTFNGAQYNVIPNNIKTGSFGITIDGSGGVISTGSKGFIQVPYNCIVTGWTIVANISGSIVVDIKKSNFSTFPTTTSIAGSDLPTLSSAQKNSDVILTGWIVAISANDIIEFVVNSVTTISRCNLIINVIKI